MKNRESIDRLKNWFYYYKWYLILGLLLAVFLVRYIGGALGFFQTRPDVQVAFVGKIKLSEEAVSAVEAAIGSFAEDYNKDGKVRVTVNQYLTANASSVAEAREGAAASNIALAGDISDCESYFFLTDNPASLQINWQILAMPDGSCPAADDYTVTDKVFSINFPAAGLSPEDKASLSGLSLGRRYFETEKKCAHEPELAALWERLKENLA